MAQPAEAEAAAERAVLQQQQQRAGQEVEPPAFNVARSAIDKAEGEEGAEQDIWERFIKACTTAYPAVPEGGLLSLLHNLQLTVKEREKRHLRSSVAAYNMGARAYNNTVCRTDARLHPLQNEKGELPPPGLFPSTLNERENLTGPRLDRLADFYGQSFAGSTVAQRSYCFYRFISHGV